MKNELFGYPELFTPIYACCVPSGFMMFAPADGLLTAVAYRTSRWFTGGLNVSFISCPGAVVGAVVAAVTADPSIVIEPVMFAGTLFSWRVTLPKFVPTCDTQTVYVPVWVSV